MVLKFRPGVNQSVNVRYRTVNMLLEHYCISIENEDYCLFFLSFDDFGARVRELRKELLLLEDSKVVKNTY